jgi:putative DNA primase/helicase
MNVRPLKRPAGRGADAAPSFRPQQHSDDALARRFARCNRDRLRYVADLRRWMFYDGTCWRHDVAGQHLELMRATCEAAAANGLRDVDDARARGVELGALDCPAVSAKVATALRSKATVQAIDFLARSDAMLVASVADFDRDPFLMATPGGTVELRTGTLRRNAPSDMLSMSTSVAPDFDADAERFVEFLNQSCGDDPDTLSFLRRWFGYAVTGSIAEHAMVFVHGPGGNGKSTLIEIVAQLMGTYAAAAPAEMLMAFDHPQHSTDLAGLVGKRLVAATETEDGKRWAESKLKQITGGDRVRARFMRQDFFEFAPSFKLIVASNAKPVLGDVGPSMRRRLRLVPFERKVDVVDKTLRERLLADEGAAILAWMIRGTQEWCAQGLGEPDSIKAATDQYFADEDRVGRWLDAAVDRAADGFAELRQLHQSFRDFEMELGAKRVMCDRKLSAKLTGKGFRKTIDTVTNRAVFEGLRLRVTG